MTDTLSKFLDPRLVCGCTVLSLLLQVEYWQLLLCVMKQ